MTREFTAALRSELPGWTICEANCANLGPAVNVVVDIQRLDYMRAAKRLKAVVQLRLDRSPLPSSSSRGRVVSEQDFDLPVAPDTPAGQARAIAVLMHSLAAKTAAMTLGNAPVPDPG
jgi:hypothetical protein